MLCTNIPVAVLEVLYLCLLDLLLCVWKRGGMSFCRWNPEEEMWPVLPFLGWLPDGPCKESIRYDECTSGTLLYTTYSISNAAIDHTPTIMGGATNTHTLYIHLLWSLWDLTTFFTQQQPHRSPKAKVLKCLFLHLLYIWSSNSSKELNPLSWSSSPSSSHMLLQVKDWGGCSPIIYYSCKSRGMLIITPCVGVHIS